MFDAKSLLTLEYPKILAELATHAQSVGAKERILSLTPFLNKDEVEFSLDETSEADRVLFEYSISPSFAVDDVSGIIGKAKKGSVLSISEIIKVGRTLRVSRRLKKTIPTLREVPILASMCSKLYENEPLEKSIFESFISDTEVSDNATETLRAIRQRIRKLNENVRTKLQSFISSQQYAKALSDNIVTVRGDRYVIPVKSDFKGAIPGLVHDQSASGATLFVEPIQIVELNNDLKVELMNEQLEIEKILRSFSAKISASEGELDVSYDTIVKMDVIFSKAQLAQVYKATRPSINEDGRILIREGRHPLIDGNKVVPVTLELKKDDKMLLITGPNTGGKTVTLKLVGLFTALAMTGFFLPAKSADISIFDGVYSDIGDEQSIEQSLSTFSAHIKNTISILDVITEKSLVLFDELGAGTDPSEGAALAVSIAEFLLNKNTKAIITSHFNDLKEFSLVTKGVSAASMEFDINSLTPTFKLIMGAIGSSNALSIAQKLGLDEGIIQNARGRLSYEKRQFDSVLSAAEETRQQASKLVSEAEIDRQRAAELLDETKKQKDLVEQKRKKLDENIRRQTKELIEDSVDEANELIEKIKEILNKPEQEVSEADLFSARTLRKKLENMSAEYDVEAAIVDAPDPTPLNVGDDVFVKSIEKRGTLVGISARGEATVQVGKINLKIKKGDYYKVKKK